MAINKFSQHPIRLVMMFKKILSPVLLFILIALPLKSSAQVDFKEWLAQRKGGYVLKSGLDGLAGESSTSFRVWVVNGYRFNRKVSAGLGVGFSYYNDPLSLLPLFIDFKYLFPADKISPFFFLKSGYNISLLTDTETAVNSHSGGLLLNPGLGLQFETDGKLSWQVSAGYNLDRATYFQPSTTFSSSEQEVTYKRLSLGIGFSF